MPARALINYLSIEKTQYRSGLEKEHVHRGAACELRLTFGTLPAGRHSGLTSKCPNGQCLRRCVAREDTDGVRLEVGFDRFASLFCPGPDQQCRSTFISLRSISRTYLSGTAAGRQRPAVAIFKRANWLPPVLLLASDRVLPGECTARGPTLDKTALLLTHASPTRVPAAEASLLVRGLGEHLVAGRGVHIPRGAGVARGGVGLLYVTEGLSSGWVFDCCCRHVPWAGGGEGNSGERASAEEHALWMNTFWRKKDPHKRNSA